MPIIFASRLSSPGHARPFSNTTSCGSDRVVQPAERAYYVAYAILIVFFRILHVHHFNPVDLAENLKTQGVSSRA